MLLNNKERTCLTFALVSYRVILIYLDILFQLPGALHYSFNAVKITSRRLTRGTKSVKHLISYKEGLSQSTRLPISLLKKKQFGGTTFFSFLCVSAFEATTSGDAAQELPRCHPESRTNLAKY